LIFCHCKRPLVAHASILPQKMGARGLLQRCPMEYVGVPKHFESIIIATTKNVFQEALFDLNEDRRTFF
jgi:hypothetical protein